jgi:hypothetical protein
MDVYYERGECAHNHCPQCRWSVHITFGYADREPCGSPMRPDEPYQLNGEAHFWSYCTGCTFALLHPTRYIARPEDYDFDYLWNVMRQQPLGFKVYELPKGAF